MNRPAFDQMCDAIRSGEVKSVVCASLSRLARNVRGLLDFVELCRHHTVSVVSLKESIDTETPSGRLFITIMSALYAFESELIGERTKDGMAAARANGIRPGPQPKLSTAQQSELRAMQTSGFGWQTRAAKHFGLHRNSIRKYVRRTP